MARTNKYRILVWIIVILLATNISMGVSFMYHKMQDRKLLEQTETAAIEIPAQRRTRFFRDELNLRWDQMDKFRELNRSFNRKAWQINHQLETLRINMVEEMGKENPDTTKLHSISTEIGNLHTGLKESTIDYYLQMKEECNEEQKKKLYDIFMSVLKQGGDIQLPQPGRNRPNTE